MAQKDDRNMAVETTISRVSEGCRRPYVPPVVQAFGRKLPAFAPPSGPPNSPKPWEQ